jgi:hypothetical protein
MNANDQRQQQAEQQRKKLPQYSWQRRRRRHGRSFAPEIEKLIKQGMRIFSPSGFLIDTVVMLPMPSSSSRSKLIKQGM